MTPTDFLQNLIAELRNGIAKTALKVGDRAPAIVLGNAGQSLGSVLPHNKLVSLIGKSKFPYLFHALRFGAA